MSSDSQEAEKLTNPTTVFCYKVLAAAKLLKMPAYCLQAQEVANFYSVHLHKIMFKTVNKF